MKKRLTKSNTNIVISGSLAGIAEYLGIDPTVLRVCYIILSFFSVGFPGIMVYILLMILIPKSRENKSRNDFFGQSTHYKENPYYQKRQGDSRPRKEAKKVDDDDDWSDF